MSDNRHIKHKVTNSTATLYSSVIKTLTLSQTIINSVHIKDVPQPHLAGGEAVQEEVEVVVPGYVELLEEHGEAGHHPPAIIIIIITIIIVSLLTPTSSTSRPG